ncbi:cell surface glycoprotein CD200 receptor 1 isoform X2 [Kryptolebias marmoratus]|uniref:cell surface glycoprotein CD200 receptor 1 isoform X2 n=1 Tax=Kryptolebias marmoratus TaxID=37003 RepID=UPI0007F88C12|nr:cell surface glycoprotein CD200 receptor 1 isoform X2 [Kryptolebias marmoratus]
MKSTMRIYILMIFLFVSWSTETGTNETISVKPNATSPGLKVYVDRKAVFKLGSSANLTCSNKTWNETIYVIWNINLKHKTCNISFSNENPYRYIDKCNDGKRVQNTSTGQSFLHIPNFSSEDVGIYMCESVYRGGNENYKINVNITVPPIFSAKMERRNNTMVAVCRAERGNPAANISWSITGNSETETSPPDSDGFVTVESILKIPEGMDPENLSCIIHHPSWDQETRVQLLKVKEDFDRLWIFIPVIGVIVVLLAGVSVFALKKVKLLRRCHQSDTPNKTPQIEDVEEVEPYASYVQRVNSIYN